MLTEDTKRLVVKFFMAMSVDLNIVNEMQYKLNTSKTLNPKQLFYVVTKQKPTFSFNDMQDFLEYLNVPSTLPEIKYILNFFHGVETVDFENFVETFLNLKSYQNVDNSNFCDFSDKLLLAKFIQAELNLIRDLFNYVRIILRQKDFDIKEMMRLIGGREEYFTEEE